MNATKLSRLTTPAGTYGLACEPWSKGEIYAVAADWAQASSPVRTYGEDGWTVTQYQVADFRHEPRAALETILQEAIDASGGDDGADAGDLASNAVEINDGTETE